MCFVEKEKASDRIAGKVEKWSLRKKGTPEALVRAVMSLHRGTRTNVKVGSCSVLTIWRQLCLVCEICNNYV